MTFDATVTLKYDATFTPTNTGRFGSTVDCDFLPEEHLEWTVPAADLSSSQYFQLFQKFLLSVGMDERSIRRGALSIAFNDWVDEKEQQKLADEFDLTMNEHLEDKYQEFLERDRQWEELQKTMDNRVVSIHKSSVTEEGGDPTAS